jgi:fructose-1,6-bisphosphatase II
MLYNGEEVGNGQPPFVDVAVDPLEGTRLTALGMPNAISVVAVAERDTVFFPGAAVYMDKIAGGPESAGVFDIEAPPQENVRRVARAKGKNPEDVTVVVLDRDRHHELIEGLREVGAKVFLITDGDVAPSIAAAREDSTVDLLMGVGGTPEGVISAAALKCLGGGMQGKLWPRDDEERQKLVDAGYDVDQVLTTDDLVSGKDVFVAATGVTTGALLKGVRSVKDGAVTDSLVMRSRSGTVRRIEAHHAFEKLMKFSIIPYR